MRIEIWSTVSSEKLSEYKRAIFSLYFPSATDDSRKRKLIEETRPPYSITINIVDDNNYQLLLYDERGYKVLHKKDLSEIEVCEAALIALRRNTREINRFNEAITKW